MVFLGVISATAGAAQNNNHTATPFTIPAAVKRLVLQSDTTGVQFEFGQGGTFNTTAAHGAFLPALNTPSAVYNTGGTQPTVSIWNPTGGTALVRVYAVPAA